MNETTDLILLVEDASGSAASIIVDRSRIPLATRKGAVEVQPLGNFRNAHDCNSAKHMLFKKDSNRIRSRFICIKTGLRAHNFIQTTSNTAAAIMTTEVDHATAADMLLKLVCEDDEDVVANALKQIYGDDDWPSSEANRKFFDLGGPFAVVSAINKYPRSKTVQSYGFHALWKYIGNETVVTEEHKATLVSLYGIEAVLGAFTRFRFDEDVVLSGLVFLESMSEDSKMVAEYIIKKVVAVPFIVKITTNFPDHSDITHEGCYLLHNLSQFEEFNEALLEAKAVLASKHLSTGLLKNFEDPEECKKVIAMLTSDD